MKIVQVSSEFSPLVRTGNLAYSVSGLSQSLADAGHQVAVFLPGYRSVFENPGIDQVEWLFDLSIEIGPHFYQGDVFRARLQENLEIYLIRRDEFFDRRFPYGTPERDYDDNDARFLFFSKAVSDTLMRLRWNVDIVHCHDWPTALVPLFLRVAEGSRDLNLAAKTVLTVHNIAYQGLFPESCFDLMNLPGEFFTPDSLEFYNQVNFLKGGIIFADYLTTVSSHYRDEMLTSDGGCGLEGVLRTREDSFVGILEGIDTGFWNPSTDKLLPANYRIDDLAGRATCRKALLKKLNFPPDFEKPIFVADNPFTLDSQVILSSSLEEILKNDLAVLAIACCSPQEEVERWREKSQKPSSNICLYDDESDVGMHLLLSGGDYFILPSMTEPCGFNQMLAQRYGLIPIVSQTGGLLDTVIDLEEFPDSGTGFYFDMNKKSFAEALLKAVALWKNQPLVEKIRQNAMSLEFSWAKPVRQYETLFKELL